MVQTQSTKKLEQEETKLNQTENTKKKDIQIFTSQQNLDRDILGKLLASQAYLLGPCWHLMHHPFCQFRYCYNFVFGNLGNAIMNS